MGLTDQQMERLTRDGFEPQIAGHRVKPKPAVTQLAYAVAELLRGASDTARAISAKRGASFVYSNAGGTDSSLFEVDASTGAFQIQALAPRGASYSFVMGIRDSSTGAYAEQTITISVTEDANGGGTGIIETSNAVTVDEGFEGSIVRLQGTGVASWTVAGTDAALFRAVAGFVEFITPPDFDSPADADTDNDYEIQIQGYDADGVLIAARNVTVSVSDTTTQPYILPEQTFSIPSNANTGAVVGTVQAFVDEGLTAQAFTITGGPGSSLFAVDASTGVVTVDASLAAADPDGSIILTVGDGTNTSAAAEVTIDITGAAVLSIEPSSIQHAPVMELVAAINCGGPEYTAADGTVYEADTENSYFTGGNTSSSASAIAGTADDTLYQTERYGTFYYDIPVPAPGLYRVTLHLAETFFSANDSREFTVRFENGNADDYTTPTIDIHQDGGGQNVAYDYVREVYIDGSFLDLDFIPSVNNAICKGIRIERVNAQAIAENEGNSGTTTYTFNVVRTGVTTGSSTADWAVTGTGQHPADAADFSGGVMPSGTVSFASNELTKQININVVGDTTSENPETFEVTLSNPSSGTSIETATASGTINDDDAVGATYRYFMVDTDTDALLTELSQSQSLPWSLVSGRNVSIYATATNVSPGSARLQLDQGTARTESVAPYSLYGDTGGGTDFLAGQPISQGAHTLTVDWYSGAGATGTLLESTTLQFSVAAPTGGVTLVNTNSAQAVELGEKTPVGARLPIVLEIQGAPAGVYWRSWSMVSDPDDMFVAVNRGVILKRALDYSNKSSHTGTVRVTMRDGSTGDFPFTLTVVAFTGTEYYVAADGSDAAAGTSGAPFATPAKAATVVAAGDIVHVKAGDYGTGRFVVSTAGTFADPIVFAGYQTTPGDGPTYGTFDETSNTPDTALMPCIDSGTRDTDLIGIQLDGAHTFATGFTVSRYRVGAYISGVWCGFKDCYTRQNGRTDTVYSGHGLTAASSGHYASFADSVSVDAGAQSLTMSGDFNVMWGCDAYCGDNTYATDYYGVASGDDCTWLECFARRAANVTSHNGHGFQMKKGVRGWIKDCETANCAGGTGFRESTASQGVMTGMVVDGDNGIFCSQGARDCLIENSTVSNAYLGLWLYGGVEDAVNYANGNYSSRFNHFRDITLTNCSYALATSNSTASASPNPVVAEGNIFERITINGAYALQLVRHGLTDDNILKDSTLTNVSNRAVYPSAWGMSASDNLMQIQNTTGVPA